MHKISLPLFFSAFLLSLLPYSTRASDPMELEDVRTDSSLRSSSSKKANPKKRPLEIKSKENSSEENSEPLAKRLKFVEVKLERSESEKSKAAMPPYLLGDIIDVEEVTDDEEEVSTTPKRKVRKDSTFKVDKAKWHGEGTIPNSGVLERAEQLQKEFFALYIQDGELTDTPKNIRKKAKEKYEEEWGKYNFSHVYAAACHYGSEEAYEIYRQFIVGIHRWSSASTFEVDEAKWQGEVEIPSVGVLERAEQLQKEFFALYIQDGELTDTPKNIRKKAKEKYGNIWSAQVFAKAYAAACQYGSAEVYEIYRQFTVGSNKSKGNNSTFEVDEAKWHGEARVPNPAIIAQAVQLQKELFALYIEDGELTDTPKNIRKKAKEMYEKKWGTNFPTSYSAACQYGSEEDYEIYRQFAVGSNKSKGNNSTFEIDETKWHGKGAIPPPGIIEKAVQLQKEFFTLYIEDGKPTDTAQNIREKAKEKYENEWGTHVIDKSYTAACQYGSEEEYKVYYQFAVRLSRSVKKDIYRKSHSTFEVDETKWHGKSALPTRGVLEKAVQLQKEFFSLYIKDGKPTDTAQNIRNKAKEKYEEEWITSVFNKSYTAACQYGSEEEYEIYRQFAPRSNKSGH